MIKWNKLCKVYRGKFYNFFVNIGANLANQIPQCYLTFESHLPTVNTTLDETVLSEDEFEGAFKLLKRNKAPNYDGLHINIIKSVYELIKKHCQRFSMYQ